MLPSEPLLPNPPEPLVALVEPLVPALVAPASFETCVLVIFEHICAMESSSLLRARVNRTHLKTAEKIFRTLGLKTGDAVNLFLAQVALRRDLPFTVTSRPGPLLSADQQAEAWTRSLGEY